MKRTLIVCALSALLLPSSSAQNPAAARRIYCGGATPATCNPDTGAILEREHLMETHRGEGG
jgi:hypothetical protein